MKRLTLLLFLWLGCTIAMTVTAGIVGLSINKESGILSGCICQHRLCGGS